MPPTTEATTPQESASAEVPSRTEDTDAAVVPFPVDSAEDDIGPQSGSLPAARRTRHPIPWSRITAFGLLPGLALLLAIIAGFLKWQDNSLRMEQQAGAEASRVAGTSTVALLSYQADTVEQDLNTARDLLSGEFKDSYTALINEVVIPGAKQKHISATAQIAGSAPISASADRAKVLVFVNQTVVIGKDPSTNSASSVRVSLEKVEGRWLITQFEPI